MNWYNSNMQKFFITNNIPDPLPGDDTARNLMDEITKKLVTPDVAIAMRAGCHFEVSLIHTKDGITMSLKSREKVSILKTPEGYPVSVIIKP